MLPIMQRTHAYPAYFGFRYARFYRAGPPPACATG